MPHHSKLATASPRLVLALLVLLACPVTQTGAAVSVEKLPAPGVQPQIVTAPDGMVHLIYLTGEPGSSDIIYRTQRSGESTWSDPLRVNSQPGSAIAIGTIRGPQFALGRNGRMHVAWNGSQSAAPSPVNGGSPLLYARLNEDGKGFSAQRNLMTATHELDGGGSVAADADGRVWVVWHASPAGSHGETNRAVFLAQSSDDGSTFAPERAISPPRTGACGCCGLTAFANARGEAFVLFRAARSMMQRDMVLLGSAEHAESFKEVLSDPWVVGMCPMSSASLTGLAAGAGAAWETAGRIRLARFGDQQANAKARDIGPLTGAKHPRLASNSRGETLVVWTVGTGWQRGGSFGWQVLAATGEPTAEKGERDGIPVWSFAAPYARPDGKFVILH